jgi:hypothetical protein
MNMAFVLFSNCAHQESYLWFTNVAGVGARLHIDERVAPARRDNMKHNHHFHNDTAAALVPTPCYIFTVAVVSAGASLPPPDLQQLHGNDTDLNSLAPHLGSRGVVYLGKERLGLGPKCSNITSG